MRDNLFDRPVELDDANTMRNLSELAATKTIIESFKKAINALTVRDKGDAEIRDHIRLRNTRPFMVTEQESLPAKKSVFNRIIGDSHFELEFASFLESCTDVLAYAKTTLRSISSLIMLIGTAIFPTTTRISSSDCPKTAS